MNTDARVSAASDAPALLDELVSAQFIPQQYEPNYPYPLLVLLHSRGGDENQLVRSIPSLSWRNYVGLGIRGQEVVHRRGKPVGYGWGPEFSRLPHRPTEVPAADRFARYLEATGPVDDVDRIENSVFAGVLRSRRALHIHSERIYLVGYGEGAAVAFRLGLTYPERFAGVISLNGWIPGGFRPLARLSECRSLRILMVHGQWNGRVPIERARRDVDVLRAGGLRVSFQNYPCGNRLTSRMLADVDSWLIRQVTEAVD